MFYLEKYIQNNKLLKPVIYFIVDVLLKRSRRVSDAELNSNGGIAIIALHYLGDSVFTIPAIREVIKNTTEKIYIVCYPETEAIYKQAFNGRVNCVPLKHEYFMFNNRVAKPAARRIVASLEAETIIDFTGVLTSVTLIFNTKAKRILGISREIFMSLYNNSARPVYVNHLMDIFLGGAQTFTPINDPEALKEFPIKIKKDGKLIIHLFAGWKAKEWGVHNFIRLAELLNKNYKLLIVFPPDSVSSDYKKQMTELHIPFRETATVQELIDTLKDEGAVFIGNDTGTAQISGFLGLPTFTLYGPTNPLFHKPRGKFHRHIQKQISCSPLHGEKLCFANGGRNNLCNSYQCMMQIEVNDVYKEVTHFLDELQIVKNNNQSQV